jgi:hypothetical protein
VKAPEQPVWHPDMLERYPMDSNAMVSDLDAERRELLLTYVEETTLSGELRAMLAEVVRRHSRYLRVKETFETLEAYRRIGQDIYEQWRDGRVERVYELCAGHGLLGLLFGYRFPKLSILCVDSERRPAFGHYKAVARELGIDLDNVRYVEADVREVEVEPPAYVVCIHACNEATKLALEKAREAGACWAAMPCCIRDGIYFQRIKHVDDGTRYAAAAGYIAGMFGARKMTAIDPRITNRHLILLGP